jgi:CRP/FNR family cyclic AMP-dependent transcriptional regulator
MRSTIVSDENQRGRSDRPQAGESADALALPPEACADILAQTALFAAMDQRGLRDLVAIGVQWAFHTGAELVHQGQATVGLFIVLQGRVRVTQRQMSGDSVELATLGRGEAFGGLALLDERPHSATVVACEPTLALVISVPDFRMALRENAEAAIRLLVLLSQRAHHAEGSGF